MDLHSHTSGTEYSHSLCAAVGSSIELQPFVLFQSSKRPSAACEGQEYEEDCNKIALFQNMLFH